MSVAATLFLTDEDSEVLSVIGRLEEEGNEYIDSVSDYLKSNTFGADEITLTLDGERFLAVQATQYIDADPQWALMKRLTQAIKMLVNYFKRYHQHGKDASFG